MADKVMLSPVVGQWYADQEASLRSDIDEMRKSLMFVRRKGICAAVVPHAGYRFSGSIAVGVYQRIDPCGYERILVLGPSHYCALRNKISIPDATHYKTPLGLIKADLDFISKLKKLPFIISEPAAHEREHSDQIQLPLIQVCLSATLPVVCMVCGQFDSKNILEAAVQLRAVLDDKTLLVLSSDFTHYGHSYNFVPFDNNVQKNIEILDNGIFELFIRKDVEGFIKKLNQTGATVCGRDPLSLLLAMMPADAEVERTAYDTSGHMLHDNSNSVSYLGAIVTGNWSAVPHAKEVISEDQALSDEAGRVLLSLARSTIFKALESGQTNVGFISDKPEKCISEINAIRGGFVTLKVAGRLRGCIGEIFPSNEIWKVVREHAYNAAFRDSRFSPLSKSELDGLEIEISVLSQPALVDSWEDIELGRHGVVLSKDGSNAVFLPQVAPELGWSREEMLSHLAVKAGLAPDAWQNDATFMVFEAQIFG